MNLGPGIPDLSQFTQPQPGLLKIRSVTLPIPPLTVQVNIDRALPLRATTRANGNIAGRPFALAVGEGGNYILNFLDALEPQQLVGPAPPDMIEAMFGAAMSCSRCGNHEPNGPHGEDGHQYVPIWMLAAALADQEDAFTEWEGPVAEAGGDG